MADRTTYFRLLLLVVLAPLLVINVFTLIAGNLLSVIPILIQVPLAWTLLTRSRRQVLFAKVWSGFLVLGGVAGLLCALANLMLRNLHSADTDYSTLTPRELVFNTVALTFGIYVFAKSGVFLNARSVDVRDVGQA